MTMSGIVGSCSAVLKARMNNAIRSEMFRNGYPICDGVRLLAIASVAAQMRRTTGTDGTRQAFSVRGCTGV
jgi:hypothetical protein